jgi:hypothetical protein
VTDIDPRRHLLSTRRYFRDENDENRSEPVSFEKEAAACHETLAVESTAEPDRYRYVSVTGGEVWTSAALLEELAARLRYDLQRGEVEPGGEKLAEAADALAQRLYERGGLRD